METKIQEAVASITSYGNKLNPYLKDLNDSSTSALSPRKNTVFINETDLKSSISGRDLCGLISAIDSDAEMLTAQSYTPKYDILDLRSQEIWKYVETTWTLSGTVSSSITFGKGRFFYSPFNQKAFYISATSEIRVL